MSVCFWENFFIFALLIRLAKNYQIDTIVELPVPIHAPPSPESPSFFFWYQDAFNIYSSNEPDHTDGMVTEYVGVLKLACWVVNCLVRIVCNSYQLIFGEN